MRPEVHAKLRLLPPPWFDHPAATPGSFPQGGRRDAELFFRALAHSYFAGGKDTSLGLNAIGDGHRRSPAPFLSLFRPSAKT